MGSRISGHGELFQPEAAEPEAAERVAYRSGFPSGPPHFTNRITIASISRIALFCKTKRPAGIYLPSKLQVSLVGLENSEAVHSWSIRGFPQETGSRRAEFLGQPAARPTTCCPSEGICCARRIHSPLAPPQSAHSHRVFDLAIFQPIGAS